MAASEAYSVCTVDLQHYTRSYNWVAAGSVPVSLLVARAIVYRQA